MATTQATPDLIASKRVITVPPAQRSLARQLESFLPYLLLLPSSLFLVIFIALPMVQALILSIRSPEGVWTLQYLNTMVHDVNFVDALRNTFLLIVFAVPLQFAFAIVMGLLLQNNLRGSSLFLYFWTIPLAVSDLAAGLVWLAVFGDRGYLNSVLRITGIMPIAFSWLSFENYGTLLMAVVIAEVWRATAIVMVIVVAGLQLIPPDYMEAAEVFGASRWQRIWHVQLPMIRPSLQVALILRTILAFQVFAVVIALAGRAMPVLASEAYSRYGELNPNGAAAYALLILTFSLITTVVYLRTLRTSEEEMGR
ncbi:MAG TPA: sugar ABC transporter permease [Anaerolineae bacterium]|nr:sugar ABC transporter permease [Anaerolineae bacterium]